ncbi:hypothetical protein [Exiguobacterium sp. SL-9]|uniref:hypothetical protein n=1 Tax=Exiguobacterium sp. SL-9 TaxID=2510963 RepID=UPI00103FB9D3|nr:hypothetical protein [Exiguobacterium sp. SL-9]TCI21620.1 hypothetical protein EVJ34_10200 [Exiguobacterium sp. SL-9]
MVQKRLQTWIDSQYENPRGIVGTYIGEKMVRQHRVEVDWTIEQLHLQPDNRVLAPGGSFVITYCDGKGDVTWDGIAAIVREQFIPTASALGLTAIVETRGPDSRDYHTVAVTGRKA